VVTAHEQAIFGFTKEMRDIINNMEMYPDSFALAEELSRFEAAVEKGGTSGPLLLAQKALWAMNNSKLIEINELLENAGISSYDIYLNSMQELRKLLVNAIFTFGYELSTKTKEADEKNLINKNEDLTVVINVDLVQEEIASRRKRTKDVLHDVISRLTFDCKLDVQMIFIRLLTDSLESMIQEMVIAPSYEVVLSAEKIIQKDMKQYFNLSYTGENMVRQFFHDFIVSFVQNFSSEASSRLNIVAVQLLSDKFLND
jgi:hypothetical protein